MAEELCCIPVLIKYPKSRLAMLGSHFCCASDLFSHACFEVSRAQDVMGCRQVRAGVGGYRREPVGVLDGPLRRLHGSHAH